MNPAHSTQLAKWLAEAGLAGKEESAVLDGFCRKAGALGIPVERAGLVIDTLHPIHEGRVFRWRHGPEMVEYGPSERRRNGRDLAPQRLFPPATNR